jgi:Protein of unknown function (DUF4242)
VGKYLVELYVPKRSDARASAVARARATAETMAGSGSGIRYLRSLFLPGDELCFLLFEAPSADAVDEAARLAALTFERIIEAEIEEGGDRGE